MFKQKSRIQWLKEGDQNTAFFHSSIKNRLNRNKILSLNDPNGDRKFKVARIKEEVIGHFQRTLSDFSPPTRASLHLVTSSINAYQRNKLDPWYKR